MVTMTRVVWLTDPHLNLLEEHELQQFLEHLARGAPKALLISGDISEAPSLLAHLDRLRRALPCPIYFVLGNHDYYFGSLREVRQQVAEFCRRHPRMAWLCDREVEELAPGVGLVGHDGWADARLGDYVRSLVTMLDHYLIAELKGLTKADRWPVLRALGDEAAAHLRRVLPAALTRHQHVYVLTHVPPLREACWYQGAISNDEWLPHFTCAAAGEVLLEVAQQFPGRQCTVLCGHTHSPGECRPLPNLRVLTGGAEYGAPGIAGEFLL